MDSLGIYLTSFHGYNIEYFTVLKAPMSVSVQLQLTLDNIFKNKYNSYFEFVDRFVRE